MTRLLEQHHMALLSVLDRLESYARYEVGRKVVPATEGIRLFSREAYLSAALANVEGTFWESMEGLEARVDEQCVAVLRDYRTFKQMAVYK